MKKIKVGVLGAYRGNSMISFCSQSENAEVVAICDKHAETLERQKEMHPDLPITYYDNFDDFIKHDMDAVVLANYANEHAPFAIRAMEAGKHVYSEVLPVQCMDEAVRLVECVEKTGEIYAFGENYCYMNAPYEMRRLYREGKIGEFEYAEGEYLHNCEPIWPSITYGDPNHWRNNMFASFYCTHSLGPIIHITGLRPVSVIGIEAEKNERQLGGGCKGAQFAIEMVTLENGGKVKSLHGGLYRDSVWYSVYGSKGMMESARNQQEYGGVLQLYVNTDKAPGAYGTGVRESYRPTFHDSQKAVAFGHGGSDYYAMDHFIRKLQGDKNADTIDVYEALDMFLPGLFAHFSILEGGKEMQIPNFRNPEEREKWRGDVRCTDPKVAGDSLLPTTGKGTPKIAPEIYEIVREKWEKEKNGGEYMKAVYAQGAKKQD